MSIGIAARVPETILRSNHVYQIEGPVSVGEAGLTIFEESPNTTAIDDGEVRVNAMANKVTAQGIGRIVEWSCRGAANATGRDEVIKVMHQGRDPKVC